MIKHLASNITCTQRKPQNYETRISRLLKELLGCEIVNRKNLGEKGIAVTNTSLNSMVSNLRNEKLIPIMSDRKHDQTCDYCMKDEEIRRFNDNKLRVQQREEMRKHVEEKRLDALKKRLLNYLARLEKYPDLLIYVPDLNAALNLIVEEVNAFLCKKKSAV